MRYNTNVPLREFILINTNSLRKLLLSFLPFVNSDARLENEYMLLRELLELDNIKQVTVSYKKPSWNIKKIEEKFNKLYDVNSEDALSEYCQEFYFLQGIVGQFIGSIKDTTSYEFFDEFISKMTFENNPSQMLALYMAMVSFFKSNEIAPLDFYKVLDNIDGLGVLDNIKIQIKKEASNKTIELDGLSEGEHQLKLIIALKELFKQTDCLFLLDEPDTYLHPEWQITLMEYLVNHFNHQVLITTHSTYALNRLTNDNLFVMKSGNVDKVREYSLYGADGDSILDFFQIVNNIQPDRVKAQIVKAKECIERMEFENAEHIIIELEKEMPSVHPDILELRRLMKLKKILG